ncbi:uncharacterized protein LOC102810089 [Saccoglossus kowalevskii]
MKIAYRREEESTLAETPGNETYLCVQSKVKKEQEYLNHYQCNNNEAQLHNGIELNDNVSEQENHLTQSTVGHLDDHGQKRRHSSHHSNSKHREHQKKRKADSHASHKSKLRIHSGSKKIVKHHHHSDRSKMQRCDNGEKIELIEKESKMDSHAFEESCSVSANEKIARHSSSGQEISNKEKKFSKSENSKTEEKNSSSKKKITPRSKLKSSVTKVNSIKKKRRSSGNVKRKSTALMATSKHKCNTEESIQIDTDNTEVELDRTGGKEHNIFISGKQKEYKSSEDTELLTVNGERGRHDSKIKQLECHSNKIEHGPPTVKVHALSVNNQRLDGCDGKNEQDNNESHKISQSNKTEKDVVHHENIAEKKTKIEGEKNLCTLNSAKKESAVKIDKKKTDLKKRNLSGKSGDKDKKVVNTKIVKTPGKSSSTTSSLKIVSSGHSGSGTKSASKAGSSKKCINHVNKSFTQSGSSGNTISDKSKSTLKKRKRSSDVKPVKRRRVSSDKLSTKDKSASIDVVSTKLEQDEIKVEDNNCDLADQADQVTLQSNARTVEHLYKLADYDEQRKTNAVELDVIDESKQEVKGCNDYTDINDLSKNVLRDINRTDQNLNVADKCTSPQWNLESTEYSANDNDGLTKQSLKCIPSVEMEIPELSAPIGSDNEFDFGDNPPPTPGSSIYFKASEEYDSVFSEAPPHTPGSSLQFTEDEVIPHDNLDKLDPYGSDCVSEVDLNPCVTDSMCSDSKEVKVIREVKEAKGYELSDGEILSSDEEEITKNSSRQNGYAENGSKYKNKSKKQTVPRRPDDHKDLRNILTEKKYKDERKDTIRREEIRKLERQRESGHTRHYSDSQLRRREDAMRNRERVNATRRDEKLHENHFGHRSRSPPLGELKYRTYTDRRNTRTSSRAEQVRRDTKSSNDANKFRVEHDRRDRLSPKERIARTSMRDEKQTLTAQSHRSDEGSWRDTKSSRNTRTEQSSREKKVESRNSRDYVRVPSKVDLRHRRH